jgi:hypothetical protein
LGITVCEQVVVAVDIVLGTVGENYSVGIVTCYEFDGPGIESQCGRVFHHPSRQVLEPTQPPVQCVPGLLPGGKEWPGRALDHPTSSSAEVEESVDLYLFSPSVLSRQVTR